MVADLATNKLNQAHQQQANVLSTGWSSFSLLVDGIWWP
jgi:hypothetical protein